MVRRSAGGRVQHGAAGTKGESRPGVGAVPDSLARHGGEFRPLAQLRCVQRLAIAVGREDVLAVAMPVDEKLDARSIPQLTNELVEALVLGGVAGLFAPVNLGAGVGRSTTGIRVPAELPVTVDVTAEAALIRCVRRRGVATLAPETVGSLRVDEACKSE